jgi:hypothetical protein
MNDNPQEEKGYILPVVVCVLEALRRLTALGIIECARGGKSTGRKGVDIYHFTCLMLLSIIIIVLIFPVPIIIRYILAFFASWRLLDIIVVAIYLSFFRPKSMPTPIPERSLSILAINYVEIIFIFSILYLAFGYTPSNICACLNHSFHVFAPIISGTAQEKTYWIYIIEIIVSLIIHITIIQRALSYFTFHKNK